MQVRGHEDDRFDGWRWPHFAPRELACRHCGEVRVEEDLLDGLETMRAEYGRPMRITSAYRCPIHNARVGGAPMSRHKLGQAADVAVSPADREAVLFAAEAAAFGGLGFYSTFLHVDIGPARSWGRRWF